MRPHLVERDAVLSGERVPLYRYQLDRIWDHDLARMVWIMLNPSTADALVDDPTIQACMDIADRNCCGSIRVVNLFAFRSPHPSDLKLAKDPVGPENDRFIKLAITDNDSQRVVVVAGWGTGGGMLARDKEVCTLVRAAGVRLRCIGLTNQGHPKHPLARGRHRVPRDAPLEDHG